jgi:UDP-glucose 4-epimerase
MATILVTGGAGFIGSHSVVQLQLAGHRCVVLDNFVNSHRTVLERIGAITGIPPALIEGDVRDAALLARAFAAYPIDCVVHFAGLKAVGESVREPARYYDNNVVGTLRMIEAMREAEVSRIVFSSSATVYGDPDFSPIPESAAFRPASPYGHSKAMVERVLTDVAHADAKWRVALLRYFNPVGAHASGTMGEDPSGVPNNLMPFVCQVAAGRRAQLSIYGNDYPTPDGTGVRDYIHVMDLADGHVAAVNALLGSASLAHDTSVLSNLLAVNLGTSAGVSVLELVTAFERVNRVTIPRQFVARRPGDVPAYFADAQLAERLLGWRATRSLDDMCRDSWNWQRQNPNGYQTAAPSPDVHG